MGKGFVCAVCALSLGLSADRPCAAQLAHAPLLQGHALQAQDPETLAGEQMLQGRQYGNAMDHFEAVLARRSSDPGARKGEIAAADRWASAEVAAGQPDHAMVILERGMKAVPDDPALFRSFGLQAMAMGQLQIADQALHAAEKLRPEDPDTTYALARLALEQQHLPDAERLLKVYLVARPRDASAEFGLGHVYAMEQRKEEARAAFERSLQLQPVQTESHYQLGQLALEAQQDAEARSEFAKVLARDPHHAGALTGMGQLALRARQYAQAEQYLAQAEASDPSYPTPHYFRGLALARLGRKEEAEAEMRRGDSRPHAPGAVAPEAGQTSAPAQPAQSSPQANPR